MKKVILFKSESEEYQKVFNECNLEAVFIEPLQFVFKNKEELNENLLQNDYDGLILASPRAIEAISKCWDPMKFVIWNTKRIYTVGEASRHNIKLLLGLEALGASSGNAENLTKIILNENTETSKFLFPCGNLRSETILSKLSTSGITVEPIMVYETKENENLKDYLTELNSNTEPLCMVFFSPSGFEYIHRQLQTFSNKLCNLPYFAIGNSTAHKIESLGVEIAGIAVKPEANSLVESIQNYFNSRS